MAQNNATFKLSIAAWNKNTQEALDGLARQSVQELAFRVVEATPVDTGFLRGSWQPSIGQMSDGPTAGQLKKHAVRKSSEAASAAASAYTGAKIAAVIAGMKAGDTFFMSNNAAYALRMEYGFVGQDKLGRNYNQWGRYYVGLTLTQWPEIVAEQAISLGLKP